MQSNQTLSIGINRQGLFPGLRSEVCGRKALGTFESVSVTRITQLTQLMRCIAYNNKPMFMHVHGPNRSNQMTYRFL